MLRRRKREMMKTNGLVSQYKETDDNFFSFFLPAVPFYTLRRYEFFYLLCMLIVLFTKKN